MNMDLGVICFLTLTLASIAVGVREVIGGRRSTRHALAMELGFEANADGLPRFATINPVKNLIMQGTTETGVPVAVMLRVQERTPIEREANLGAVILDCGFELPPFTISSRSGASARVKQLVGGADSTIQFGDHLLETNDPARTQELLGPASRDWLDQNKRWVRLESAGRHILLVGQAKGDIVDPHAVGCWLDDVIEFRHSFEPEAVPTGAPDPWPATYRQLTRHHARHQQAWHLSTALFVIGIFFIVAPI